MTKSSFPLPQDWRDAVLVGRIDMGEGPTPVVVKEGRVFDVSRTAPTVSVLLEKWNGVPDGKDLGDINDLGLETAWSNGGKNCTCAMQVQELETRLQYAWSPHGPAYRPSPAEFRTVLLPALRDAIVAWHLRRSGDPRIPKDPSTFVVEFIDQAADDRSTSP